MNQKIAIVTGSSKGIGAATVKQFIKNGYFVHGIDIDPTLPTSNVFMYEHHIVDVSKFDTLPDIENVDILINNAGTQEIDKCISTNLGGLINTTRKYGLQENIKSICNLASASSLHGAEFDTYVASKGGVASYTIWTAKEIAKFNATCNALSFGGVTTSLNQQVIDDEEKWNQIMELTPLKRWMSPEECADWIYFITAINHSCTGQNILIDNGEFYSHKFVW